MNPIGHRHLAFDSVASTNASAASHSNDPANHGLVITAEAQTAGRGQYQRVWQAPPDSSVLMSVLLFPPLELRRASLLTAWAAVSVCKTIHQSNGLSATIKWPNDILIHGKKVCGILCEGGANFIIAGIGLNVNQAGVDFERMGLPDATSLAIASGRSVSANELTANLIQNLDREYDLLLHGKTSDLEIEWTTRLGLLGRQVLVEKMDGSDATGHLRAMAFDGIVLEIENELTILPPEIIRHLSIAVDL